MNPQQNSAVRAEQRNAAAESIINDWREDL